MSQPTHGDHDDVRLDLFQLVVAQAPVVHDAWRIILDHGIAYPDEPLENISPAFVGKVERYSLLAGVKCMEVGASIPCIITRLILGIDVGSGEEIGPLHRLYLYDLSPQFGHDLGAHRTRKHHRQINDADAVQKSVCHFSLF